MKPLISNKDYGVLKSVIRQWSPVNKTRELQQLEEELANVKVVQDHEMTPDVIRLNSYFEVAEESSSQLLNFTLVLPGHADFKMKKISVLSPLGIALIGYKEGMTIDCTLPAGKKIFKILKVLNEPRRLPRTERPPSDTGFNGLEK